MQSSIESPARPREDSAGGVTEMVRVPLDERAYDVLIGDGLLAQAGRLVRARLPKARRAGIVCDETVAGLHLDALLRGLEQGGIDAAVVRVPPGESTKSFRHLEEVLDRLLEAGLERGDVVLALGGGVVGDLAGCAAGLLRRGVAFVQIPTTLLAQVDSSVGGKTGINTRHGKNLVGVFHQPRLVLADTATLASLPIREFRAGYAEMAKYGLLADAGFFAWLEARWRDVFSGGEALVAAVKRSVEGKAEIVAQDEREEGRRALLNLGHTFGHALEAATGYGGRLIHGEAVSIGIVLAFRFSAREGVAAQADAERVEAHLRAVGLPTRIADIPGPALAADRLVGHIRQDKKVRQGRLAFVLARRPGEAFLAEDVPEDRVRTFLEDEIART